MDMVLIVLRLGLAIVFGIAGASKLFDRSGTKETLVSFGVREPFVRMGAVLLPLAELAVAGALLAPGSARWGALAAVVLLVVFVGGLANALAHGRTPDCHCFGQLHSTPASWKTVGRNVVLGLVAFGVAAGSEAPRVGGTELVAMTATVGAIALLAALRATRAWLPEPLRARIQASPRLSALAGAASRVGLLGPRGAHSVQGLPVGDRAPDFQLRNLENEPVTLGSLQNRAKPTVLIFSDPGCPPCLELLPEIARWQRENSSRLTIAVITSPLQDPVEHAYTAKDVLVQQDREVASAYAVRDMPSAILISADRSIGSPLAVGAEAIAALVNRIAAEDSIV